jgi:uncharacterized protein YeaO (DUF488 family)
MDRASARDAMMRKRTSRSHRAKPRSVRAYSSPACSQQELASPASDHEPVQIKRIYAAASTFDGWRVLVDRLWPRGVKRDRAALDEWLPAVAPTTKLRQWFHRDSARWTEFRRRYRAELRAHGPELLKLRAKARAGRLTLLYAARDPRFNHAAVLREVLLANRDAD